jgi:hypothetical protein
MAFLNELPTIYAYMSHKLHGTMEEMGQNYALINHKILDFWGGEGSYCGLWGDENML